MSHDNPPNNRFEVKSKPSTLKKCNENTSPQQKRLCSIPPPSVPLRNISLLEVGAVIPSICQGRREIFDICFKNINGTITLTLRKVQGTGFGISHIYEHISGMKFSRGNWETVVEKQYVRAGISHSPMRAPYESLKDFNFTCLSESHPVINLQHKICKH